MNGYFVLIIIIIIITNQFPSNQGDHSRDFTNLLSFYAPGNEVPVGQKNNNKHICIAL